VLHILENVLVMFQSYRKPNKAIRDPYFLPFLRAKLTVGGGGRMCHDASAIA
jgi:hypothetical protein